MKKSFLNHGKPWMTAFLMSPDPDDAVMRITKAIEDGADSVCIEVTRMAPEFWTRECITRVFEACGDLPIYACCYRSGFGEGHSDDELAELLLLCLDCGATLLDVMGDLYHPEPWQMTLDEEAAAKQTALIQTIHERGGEVIMSAHNHGYYEPEQILAWMLEQKKRGCDVAKDICVADNEDQLISAVKTYKLLNENLGIPYLYMVGGAWNQLTRLIGPRLGTFMYLGRAFDEGIQPKVSTLKFLMDELPL